MPGVFRQRKFQAKPSQTPDGSLCLPPTGTTFHVKAALTAGGGTVTTTDPHISAWLASHPAVAEIANPGG
jgi:hypothetical protein